MDTGLPCVHCGLCLDTCPTYRVLGHEADSPRGRIHIMQAIDDGELELDREAAGHLDACLGCLACETACPSGVSFGRRIERYRPRLAAALPAGPWRRAVARVAGQPGLLRAAAATAQVLDTVGLGRLRRRLPGLGLMPSRRRRRGQETTSSHVRRAPAAALDPVAGSMRVAVLRGCVADVLLPAIHSAAADVLRHHGLEVVEVAGQCCGALDLHAGRMEPARAAAARTVRALTDLGVDRVVTTAAGCGAAMRAYGELLDDPDTYAEGADPVDGRERADPVEPAAAARIAELTADVSELLVELGIREPARPLPVGPVAYHDACHLLHACGISAQPREIVRAATGTAPLDLGDNHVCCGSAGSYNLEHGPMASELGRRKAELAAAAGASLIAVGNVGCILQLERALARAGLDLKVRHPVELLAEAYRLE